MIRNIIFDWSGTLVDDLPAVWHATNFVFRQAQIPELTIEQFRGEFCLPFTIFYDRYTPHIPLPQLEEWFHAHYCQLSKSVCALPHAREFLEFCRARGLRLFVLSTVRRDHFQAQAALTGFASFMERVYLEVRNKREKIAEILQENDLTPAETLLVGDMEHDIATARAGGVHSCGVLTGYNTLGQLRAAGPERIVEHLGELRLLLEQSSLEWPVEPGAQAARRPVVTVGALVSNARGEILLVRTQKWSQLWGIPGGKIDYGETGINALRRELKEETGLAITGIELVMVQDCIESIEFYRPEHFVLLNYKCRVEGANQVRLNYEACDYRWVRSEQALSMQLNSPTRKLLDWVRQERHQVGVA